jgi:hypothetical protein
VPLLGIDDITFTGVSDAKGQPFSPGPEPAEQRRPVRLIHPTHDGDTPFPITGRQGGRTSVTLLGLPADAEPAQIRGLIHARFLVPRPVVTAGRVLEAVGKTVAGRAGVELTVREAGQGDDGKVTLVVRLNTLAPFVDPDSGPQAVRVRAGVVTIGGPADVALDGFGLTDGAGRPLPRLDGSYVALPAGQGTEFRLTYDGRPGEAGLGLVLRTPRVVPLAVPFAVKGVADR